jgi:ABC-2 type transport system permease protein
MTQQEATLVVHQIHYDLRAFRRNRQACLSTVLLPVVLLVLIVSSNRGERVDFHGQSVGLAQYMTPGLAAFGVVAASFLSLIVEVVAQRESGVLKRRRATPVAAWQLIAGRTATAAVVSLAVTFLLLVVAGNSYNANIPTSGIPALMIVVVLGAVCFCSLGYAITTWIRNAAAAQPVASLILLPFLFISSVLVPTTKLPDRLATLASIFPLEHLADAMRHALDPTATGMRLDPGDLANILTWAVAASLVAYRRFAWLPLGAEG